MPENKCVECLHFPVCEDYTTENETFPEVGGCAAFISKADVVEVVRCKDCEHIHLIGKTPFAVRVCTHNKGLGDNVRENDFCSYGKKKEGAEE